MCPQLSRVVGVIELNKCAVIEPTVGSSYSVKLEDLEKDHRVYAFLARVCTSLHVQDCISRAICASSTDSYPGKRIENTGSPCRAFYWSSKGQSNPAVPETLIYELVSEFCIISAINICPFQGIVSKFLQNMCFSSLNIFQWWCDMFIFSAYFQSGSPIYSAKSVRFRMGYPKIRTDVGKALLGYSYPSADDKFIWTYTSQEFPMAQVCCSTNFCIILLFLCISFFFFFIYLFLVSGLSGCLGSGVSISLQPVRSWSAIFCGRCSVNTES